MPVAIGDHRVGGAFDDRRRWLVLAGLMVVIVATLSGCKRNPSVVPVSGKVLYNDKPLPYGSIMFQPEKGQPASADIQPDGSFKLSSYSPFDGAVPGKHMVSVKCYQGQKPGAAPATPGGEISLGRLLIPLQYTRFATSGLTAEITAAPGQTVEFKLSGPPFKE